MKRVVVFALCVSIAPVASASYELLLAVDAENDQVYRYDPVSGMSLGSFGTGYMVNPAKIAVDASAGIAYVTNYGLSTVQAWNYSSGQLLSEFAVGANPWGLARLAGGNLAMAFGSQVRIYTPGGTLVNSFAANGFGLGYDGTNLYVGGTSVNKYSVSGTLLGTVALPSGRQAWELNFRNGMGYVGGSNYGGRFGQFNTSTMSGYVDTVVGNLTTSVAIEGTAFSHGSHMYVFGASVAVGNPLVFSRYHLLSNQAVSTFGSGFNAATRISGMAIVLAPEPSSVVALALGGLVLLRRRK